MFIMRKESPKKSTPKTKHLYTGLDLSSGVVWKEHLGFKFQKQIEDIKCATHFSITKVSQDRADNSLSKSFHCPNRRHSGSVYRIPEGTVDF